MPPPTSARRDALAFAGLAVGLLAWFAGPGIVRGFVFPVGPDAPVYLWWTRLVGVEGLSSVTRPGVPALALVLAGTLGASESAILAALEIAGGLLTGVVGAALLRLARPEDRATWMLGGALAGTFSVHVATGYLATLVFGVLFLASVAALLLGTRRAVVMATALLGAGALAHPRFLAVGAAILLVAAGLAWRDDRAEVRRILAVAAGGAGILALAGAALLVGPSPLLVDTSRDAFLRRVGLAGTLRASYMARFVDRWTRYAPWGVIPAIVVALRRPRTTLERVLIAWIIVAAGGAIFSALTGLLPIDRFLTFAYAAPLLAAVGITALGRTDAMPRALRRPVAAALALAMLVGSWTAWAKQAPYADARDLRALRSANAVAAISPGEALVFPVGAEWSAFVLTLFGNLVRATVPPERIRDVVMTETSSALGTEAEAITRQTAEDVRIAIAAHGGRLQRILVVPFAEWVVEPARSALVAPDLAVDPPLGRRFDATDAVDPVEPFSPWLPTLLALGILALLAVTGWTWARIVGGDDPVGGAALAPGIGLGIVILTAFVLERLGLPLAGTTGPLAVAAIGLASGPIARRFLDRRGPIADGDRPGT